MSAQSGIVLIIEDNRSLAETVGSFLESRDFEVDFAADGQEGFRLSLENHYDAIILDGSLPRLDGLEVCRRLRTEARNSTPIIMLTARDTLADKLAGLESGADDYLTKPFAPQELEARLRAVMRRSRKEQGNEVLTVGDLIFDPASHRVSRAGQELVVSPIGTKLLHILMRETPRVVTRREIEGEIWGSDLPDSDTLRSHLYNLRRIIDKGFDAPLLHTVQSMGYRMADLSKPVQTRRPLAESSSVSAA